MPGHDIVVIGASAGGVEALIQLVGELPADLAVAIFVVVHIPAEGPSVLPKILNRYGPIRATHPINGEQLRPGHIYVAPPDYHLLLKPEGIICLVRGPRENGHRPAVDPLFRTAARVYGPRVVGVVLSGTLDDGTAGLAAIKSRGGIAVVQDPEDALYAGMPRNAIENVDVDHIVPLSRLPALLKELSEQPVAESAPDNGEEGLIETESDIAEMKPDQLHKAQRPGVPSGFGCPECGGVLWELNEEEFIRFRCRTGHAFSPDTLLAKQNYALEEALWTAFRALEERSALLVRLAERIQSRPHSRLHERFLHQAHEATRQAELIRKVLVREETPPGGTLDESVA